MAGIASLPINGLRKLTKTNISFFNILVLYCLDGQTQFSHFSAIALPAFLVMGYDLIGDERRLFHRHEWITLADG